MTEGVAAGAHPAGVQWKRFLGRRSSTRSPGLSASWTSLPRCPNWVDDIEVRWCDGRVRARRRHP